MWSQEEGGVWDMRREDGRRGEEARVVELEE